MKESDKEAIKGLLIKKKERWQRRRKRTKQAKDDKFLYELFYSSFLNKKQFDLKFFSKYKNIQ